MKILSALMASAVLLASASAQDKPATASDNLFADPVIVKGMGIEIHQSRLDEAVASVKAGAMSRGETISPQEMPLVQKKVFDNLLLNQLLLTKATDADKAKGKEEGEKRFDLVKKRATSEDTLTKQLKAIGLTLDTLHARLIDEATAQVVMRGNITITDEQVKKFYEDHPGDFEQPEMIRASHILLLTTDPKTGTALSDDLKKAKRKSMEDLLKRAKAGEDFSKLAKENSDDQRAKESGGESTFPREAVPLEFWAAASSLKTNQVSEVVESRLGYHIIKLSEKIPAKKYDLAKVSPDIKDFLTRQEVDKNAPELYMKLRKDAKVEILDARLKALSEADDAAKPATTTAPK